MIGGQNRRTSTSGSMYGATSFGIGGSSALIEMLQSTLKQRDGENHQLQWQLSRLQSERNFLMSEVAKLNEQLENVINIGAKVKAKFGLILLFDSLLI